MYRDNIILYNKNKTIRFMEKKKKKKKFWLKAAAVLSGVVGVGAAVVINEKLKDSRGKNLELGSSDCCTDYGKEHIFMRNNAVIIDNVTTMEEEPGCLYSGTRLSTPPGLKEVNNGEEDFYLKRGEIKPLPYSGKFGLKNRLQSGYETFSGKFNLEGV